MDLTGIYHRPESEYAFITGKDTMSIRLRTVKDDIESVELVAGDPYAIRSLNSKWFNRKIPMKKGLSTDLYDYWTVSITEPKHRLAYGFFITDQKGQQVLYNDQGFQFNYDENYLAQENNYFRMPFFQQIDMFNAPEWVKNTVWYQIFPERFANGDPTINPKGTKEWDSTIHPGRQDFYGGDLQGVIDHLDHLVDLGVNGIYFNPIFKAPSNHKYDTEDYFEIDPHFGNKELFKKLVSEAHKRNIKVMLDAVFNHIGDQSPQWQDVLQHGKDSQYADWFHINGFPIHYTPTDNFEFAADANYETFDYTPHMPKLNTANKEVQDYLLSIATYWIKEFDIDAWRLDVANEIDHHFWREFHDATTALKPDFYILGEIWHTAQPWLQGDQFTGVMNYAYIEAIKEHFIEHVTTATEMKNNLNRQLMLYNDAADRMMFNVLDSHDTARIKTLAHDDMDLVKQIFGFTFIQPGTPSIYYGTEYGMTGENDPDDRKPMVWNEKLQDHDFYAFMQKLIKVRKQIVKYLDVQQLNWSEIDDELGFMKLNYGNLEARFNTGVAEINSPIENAEILIENGYQDEILNPKGFAIYIKK